MTNGGHVLPNIMSARNGMSKQNVDAWFAIYCSEQIQEQHVVMLNDPDACFVKQESCTPDSRAHFSSVSYSTVRLKPKLAVTTKRVRSSTCRPRTSPTHMRVCITLS
jgi:hypothetical protein